MKSENKQGFFSNLRHDLPAGVVVFLVAMPLCLGIALVSGAPLFSGIIAGIVGGIVVSILSGSPLGVSGPAAGLAAIVVVAIKDLGAFDVFLVSVVIAGIIQLILGFLKAGVIGYYFPSSVIKGMLAGIGIFIVLKEIPHALGYDENPFGDFSFFQWDGHNTISELWYAIIDVKPGALIMSSVALGILILWEQPFMKKVGAFKVIQGALVAVLSGIGLNLLYQKTGWFEITDKELVHIPSADSFEGIINLFTVPDFSQLNNPEIYIVALLIAVVASLETLLCVEATDKLDPQKRVTPTNRELIAQGTGNVISGMIGGLPITQVIVRSSANIQSGGKTKASAFFHGILLLVFVLSIPSILNLIPYASLAAILFMVGYKLAKPSLIRQMWNKGRSEFVPFIVTILGIVFTDLLKGIALGMVFAIFHILWKNYQVPYHFNPKNYKKGEPIIISLSEHVTFLNKAGILRTLDELPDGIQVKIDVSKVKTIHPDVVEIIEDFRMNSQTRDITIEFELPSEDEQSFDAVKEFQETVSEKSED